MAKISQRQLSSSAAAALMGGIQRNGVMWRRHGGGAGVSQPERALGVQWLGLQL